MLYMLIGIVILLDIVAILRLLYKKLGKYNCAKENDKNIPEFNNADAFAKMRRLIK